MRNAPPPERYALYGNLQILPRPTAYLKNKVSQIVKCKGAFVFSTCFEAVGTPTQCRLRGKRPES